jgi:zinc protease
VAVAFPQPAFEENSKDSLAIDMLSALYFGPTSDLYKRLVVTEQIVDELNVSVPSPVDPYLMTVFARVKKPADTVAVRDAILATFAAARDSAVPPQQLSEAKSHERYSFARSLDSTEQIASSLAFWASFRRSFDTVNNYYRTLDALQPADIQAAAQSQETNSVCWSSLPENMTSWPELMSPTRSVGWVGVQPTLRLLRFSVTASSPPGGT